MIEMAKVNIFLSLDWGIPKNDREIGITFDFLALQEGPGGLGADWVS